MVLGLDLGSVLGGFAAEGTEYFDEKEKAIESLISKSWDKWLIDGPANFKAHVAQKKKLRTLAKALEGYNLGNDKIGVILEQGRGDEVLKYLNTMSTLTGDAKAKFLEPLGGDISNIVKFAPDYKESGLTLDQIVNKVGGKITGGMSLSDAFADVGQDKQNTFAKIFSPNVSNIANRRMKAYESVYGKGALDQARKYATGAVTTDSLGFTGTVAMPDPVASKAVLDTLGGEKGYITGASFNTRVKEAMAGILDTSVIQGDFTVPKSIKDELGANIKNDLMDLVNKEMIEYNSKLPQDQKGLYTDEFLGQLRIKMEKRVNAIRNRTDDSGDGTNFDSMTTTEAQQGKARYTNMITNRTLNITMAQWLDDYAKFVMITGEALNKKDADKLALDAYTKAYSAGKKGSAVRKK